MQPGSLLGRGHPKKDCYFNIRVYPINIGKCMVNHIMLHIPHKVIGTKHTYRRSSYTVHPFFFTKTTMTPIMHYIKTNGCNNTPQNQTL